jgi:hypothetical protein
VLYYSPEKKSDALGDKFNCVVNDSYFVVDFANPAIRKNQQNAEDERENHQVTFYSGPAGNSDDCLSVWFGRRGAPRRPSSPFAG